MSSTIPTDELDKLLIDKINRHISEVVRWQTLSRIKRFSREAIEADPGKPAAAYRIGVQERFYEHAKNAGHLTERDEFNETGYVSWVLIYELINTSLDWYHAKIEEMKNV